jgi:hypothetical protein
MDCHRWLKKIQKIRVIRVNPWRSDVTAITPRRAAMVDTVRSAP